ncbi:hypothetical protein Hdeb2414_s0014g00424691 [Helianthus debilis subsp. tardiflorus]
MIIFICLFSCYLNFESKSSVNSPSSHTYVSSCRRTRCFKLINQTTLAGLPTGKACKIDVVTNAIDPGN